MAQLQRLRSHLDAHEKIFTTVDGLANFISGPDRDGTCAIQMCFFRGDHFSTGKQSDSPCQNNSNNNSLVIPPKRYNGTHLEFVDAESASSFDEVCRMIQMLPINIVGKEICRLTVWERIDLASFKPGTQPSRTTENHSPTNTRIT